MEEQQNKVIGVEGCMPGHLNVIWDVEWGWGEQNESEGVERLLEH